MHRESKVLETNENIKLEISLLEFALTILLKQTLIAKNCANINQMDKQLFFREMNNEMVRFLVFLGLINVYTFVFSFRIPSPRTSPGSLSEGPIPFPQ